MKSVIWLLIIFFIVLILWEIFLAHFIVEGLENNTSVSPTGGVATVSIPANINSVTTISPSPTISSSSINATTINASSVNSTNPSYLPYTSPSENIVSFVEQNANNVSYLKNKMDNLYQQVQDISGNISILNNSTSQIGKVNEVINKTQASLPVSPPKVTGTSQSPSNMNTITNYANSLVPT